MGVCIVRRLLDWLVLRWLVCAFVCAFVSCVFVSWFARVCPVLG